ncbi:MAG TPA: threonine--tRNA ligase [Candidatus Dormibacteraeota bacterium]|jgi:threonyl-tRNA synthetase|nr:threonine--tRNA ligase [Candidatus Dormibacteraeota bacterium]
MAATAVDVEVLRHSAAHLLAAAVCELFPGAKYAIGPAIEDGFYYDLDLPVNLREEDLAAVEQRMREIAARRPEYRQEVLPKTEAVKRFADRGQTYKLEILTEGEARAETEVSCYWTGDFFDLCRGPHVADAGAIQHFRLTRLAGAYWRGDEKNKMLQRIYGTAWNSERELEDYFQRLELARERDHKKLGKELGLFFIDEAVGKGLPMWLPRGATVRRQLEEYILDAERRGGYQHVYTPHIASEELYRISGHLQSYRDSMFSPFGVEDESYILRPMNCPHHIRIYQHERRSYRELPLRIGELGTVYRYEKSGELAGLVRVRGFTINDAHIFCAPDQVKAEFKAATQLILDLYAALHIEDFKFRFSRRDPADSKYIGGDAMWDSAEAAIREALVEIGRPFSEEPGEAAFYGPKLDVQIRDAMGREFSASTTQLDFLLPERFGLEYVGPDGEMARPAMIHRAPIGSLERFMAFLIEHFAGAFPVWLAPVQIVLVPISDKNLPYVERQAALLRDRGLRVEIDSRAERMQAKIRHAELQKVPFIGVAGGRDEEAGTVSLRRRHEGDLGPKPAEEVADILTALVASRG